MNDLKTTAALVKTILENDVQSRNSDSLLYLKVLGAVANRKGIALDSMTVPCFLSTHHGTAFPCFETVRRARQKVQQHHPHLCACSAVEGFRAQNEETFRAFARGDVL